MATAPATFDLDHFVDPARHSQYLRIEDNGDTLTVHPLGFPLWFAWTCLAMPLAAWGAVLVFDPTGFFTRTANRDYYHLAIGVTSIGVPIQVVCFQLIMSFLNRQYTRHGPFFVLDRIARTLTLPRVGRTLTSIEILGFLQTHGWHTVFKRRAEESSNWLAEITVFTRNATGELERLPVVAALRTGKVDQLGELLAAFFDRPRQVIRPRLWQAITGALFA